MASGFVRGLLLIVLGLGVAGFGICSLCGGVMGVGMFFESKQSSRDIGWLALGDIRALKKSCIHIARPDGFHAQRRVVRLEPA